MRDAFALILCTDELEIFPVQMLQILIEQYPFINKIKAISVPPEEGNLTGSLQYLVPCRRMSIGNEIDGSSTTPGSVRFVPGVRLSLRSPQDNQNSSSPCTGWRKSCETGLAIEEHLAGSSISSRNIDL